MCLWYATNSKKREQEIGPALETRAKESCEHATEEEVRQTGLDSETGADGITVSYNMGWQKRLNR